MVAPSESIALHALPSVSSLFIVIMESTGFAFETKLEDVSREFWKRALAILIFRAILKGDARLISSHEAQIRAKAQDLAPSRMVFTKVQKSYFQV